MVDREKKILLFFLIIFFGFCALIAAQKITSFDVWWHLKTGEWIWQHKTIPFVDPFSYTFRGAEWIDFEWLFQAVIYPIYQFCGFEGLIFFKIIITSMIFVILFLTCREVEEGNRWLSITILFVALLVARGRFTVRPQIISLFFLAFYLYVLTLYRGERITARQLILFLVPAQIFWVNVHGGFLMGTFLAGAYTVGRFVPLALRHHQNLTLVFKDKKLQSLLLVCLLLCVASLLNPYTYKAFLVPFQTAGSETLSGITEWTPVNIRLLGVFASGFNMWFRILFIIGVISFLIKSDNLKKVEALLIFAFFSYIAFKHVRFGGEFAIASAPIIVNNLRQLRWRVKGWQWFHLLPLLIVISFAFHQVITLQKQERLGLGVWTRASFPHGTMDFLKRHDVKGRIFNTYGHGGYIIWHGWPDISVFIDGRTVALYDQDFFWLYILMQLKKEIWEEAARRYEIDIVLVRDSREKGYSMFFNWLDEDEDWRLVAFDDVSNLYMRKGEKFDKFIQQYGFHYLRPSDLFMDYAKEKKDDKAYLKALELELKEACQRFPQDFYPFYYLGVYHQIYGTEDHFQEAENVLRRAVANRPDFSRGYYELGFTLMKLERYDDAVRNLKKAIKLNPNISTDVYYYLGTSLFYKDDINGAIKFLESYKKKTTWGTRVEAYRLLGRAYLQRYKFRKALSCFKRERYLGESNWETLVNMGVAYFGLDMLDEARESFEQAREMNPDEIKIVYNLAVTYEKLRLFEQAKQFFRQVTGMKPKNAEERVWVEKAKRKLSGGVR